MAENMLDAVVVLLGMGTTSAAAGASPCAAALGPAAYYIGNSKCQQANKHGQNNNRW